MESNMIRKLSYEDLQQYTDGFSEANYIGNFQFGKVYRGKIQQGATSVQEVTVKIWEPSDIYQYYEGDNEVRLRDEIFLLQHETLNSHPNLVKLIGYCCEAGERLGVVYDLRSLDTAHNLLLKDDFTWLQRIKVALGFARLLKFLHTENPPYLPYLVRNIAAAHIMLDQDYNPRLYDFSMICGGVLPDWSSLKNQYIYGSYGYIDLFSIHRGQMTEYIDVFAFGVVLLSFITKRIYTEEDRQSSSAPLVYEWARSEYRPKRSILGFERSSCSLVHESLEAEPFFYQSDGTKVTRLAMQCVEINPWNRPSMEEVVKRLLNLHVVRRHA